MQKLAGYTSVALPATIADAGKVRLGGMAPSLPATIADAGKVRLGGMAPRFSWGRAILPYPVAM